MSARGLVLAGLLLLLSSSARARVDFVLVILDDVSRFSVGAYGETGMDVPTPQMDALAAAGVRFEWFRQGMICSAFRTAVYSGYRATRPQNAVGDLVLADATVELDPYGQHLFRKFQAAGWRAGLVGKLHVASEWAGQGKAAPSWAAAAGFDFAPLMMLGNPARDTPTLPAADTCDQGTCNVDPLGGGTCSGGPHDGQPCWAGDHHSWIATDLAGSWWLETGFSEDRFSAEAITILRDADPRPTFLSYSTSAPHSPFDRPPGGSCTDEPSCYDELLTYVDTTVGLLAAELDFSEDHLLIVADNGRPNRSGLGAEGVCDHTNSKAFPYQCGTAGPMIYRGPLAPTPGVSTAMLQVEDLHATVLGIAGILEQVGATPDSRDMSSCLGDPAGCTGRAVSTGTRFDPNQSPPPALLPQNIWREGGEVTVGGTLWGYYRVEIYFTDQWEYEALYDLSTNRYTLVAGPERVCTGDPCLPAPTDAGQQAIDLITAELDANRANGGVLPRPTLQGVSLDGGLGWE